MPVGSGIWNLKAAGAVLECCTVGAEIQLLSGEVQCDAQQHLWFSVFCRVGERMYELGGWMQAEMASESPTWRQRGMKKTPIRLQLIRPAMHCTIIAAQATILAAGRFVACVVCVWLCTPHSVLLSWRLQIIRLR
jgi:hypothetical protein